MAPRGRIYFETTLVSYLAARWPVLCDLHRLRHTYIHPLTFGIAASLNQVSCTARPQEERTMTRNLVVHFRDMFQRVRSRHWLAAVNRQWVIGNAVPA
jgi:hypothetical protein